MSFLRKIVLLILVLCFTVPGFSLTVVHEIDVGYNNLIAIAVNPITSRIYVTCRDDARVAVINGETNSVITTIGVGDFPRGVCVNSQTNRIYVANKESDNISVINGATNSVIATVTCYDDPSDIEVNEYYNFYYVTCPGAYHHLVIKRGSDNTTITAHNVFNNPYYIAVNSQTNKIYVTDCYGDHLVYVFHGATRIGSFEVGMSPYDIAVNSQTNRIYVTGSTNHVYVVDGADNSVITNIHSNYNYGQICVNPQNNRIYVVNPDNQEITAIDGEYNEVIATLELEEDYVSCIYVDPVTNLIYVGCLNGKVLVIEDQATGIEESLDNPPSLSFKVSPNPFSSITEFVLNLPDGTDKVDFSIYDVSGTMVKSFPLGNRSSSPITLSWDGKDYAGNKCGSGVYFGVLKAGNTKPVMEKVIKLQ